MRTIKRKESSPNYVKRFFLLSFLFIQCYQPFLATLPLFKPAADSDDPRPVPSVLRHPLAGGGMSSKSAADLILKNWIDYQRKLSNG